jgi:hypothetical protein
MDKTYELTEEKVPKTGDHTKSCSKSQVKKESRN